jgi:hypothetical protein
LRAVVPHTPAGVLFAFTRVQLLTHVQPNIIPIIMAPKKKTVERTAASSRPKRTPKPTTVATSSAPAPKPKKKPTATKKAAPKKAVAAGRVTKKAAPKKAAPKKAAPKKAAPKKAAPKKAAPKKAAPTYQKLVVKADGSNPLGAVGEKRIRDRDAALKASAGLDMIELRHTDKEFMYRMEHFIYPRFKATGKSRDTNTFEDFVKWSKKIDKQAWDKAHEQKIGSLEGDCTGKQYHEMMRELREDEEKGKNPHIRDTTDYLYWKEIEKERETIMDEYMKKSLKHHDAKGNGNGNGGGNGNRNGNRNGNVSAISSPVKKAQNTSVNASPVKKVQEAFTGGRSGRSKSPEKKSPQKKSPEKKNTSNDSGYQADNEQQGVMSRTWELAANAVEAMRSAVNPE